MTDLTLPHIVCHLHVQRCAYCNATQTYSHVYLCETVGRTKKLKPLASPSEAIHLPAILTEMPARTIAFCHLCLSGRPMLDAEAHSRWQETLRRKNIDAPSPAASHTPSRNSTVDDLD